MMDVVQSLQLVAANAKSEVESVLMWACLAVLAAFALGGLAWWSARALAKLTRTFSRGTRAASGITLIALVALVAWAGVGSGWSFVFMPECGIVDAGSSCDQALGVVEARWTYSPVVASYDFKWFYKLKYGKGDERGPFDLPDAKVRDGYAVAIIPESGWEAITITCYTKYVAPVQVVTNGVYHVNGVMRSMNTQESEYPKYLAPGVPIWIDANLLTPHEDGEELELMNIEEEPEQ